jgi:hypothetical protein
MAKRFKGTSQIAKGICLTTGKRNAIDGVIQIAEELTRLCGLTHPAHHIDRLASWQSAKIQSVSMKEAGQLIPTGRSDFEYLIQVNDAHPQARQNFSACHEIGHTLLSEMDDDFLQHHDAETMCWDEEAEEEFLCDVAAAELLMPRREFIPRLRGCEMRIEAIAELATEFGSSLEATALNLVRAEVDDVAVIVWELGRRKSQEQEIQTLQLWEEEDSFGPVSSLYRIKFAWACGQMCEYWFPHNKSIEEDSLIYKAARTALSVSGPQKLPIGQGRTHTFFTQSQSFPIWREGELQKRVFTLAHLRSPQ